MTLALALLAPAYAFAPSQDVWLGVEPVRVSATHSWRQATLARSVPWRAFTSGEGAGWEARFDEGTGTPHRAWGPGIPLGTVTDGLDVEDAVRAFFERNPGIVGVPLEQLVLSHANYVPRLDTWYVEFDRIVSGYPVWRGGVTARVRHGLLVLFGVDTHPGLVSVQAPQVTANAAIDIARVQGPAPISWHQDAAATLVILPRDVEGVTRYALTYEVHSRTTSPLGVWVSHVDAMTGELLDVSNQIRFVSGTISGVHDTRTLDGSMSTSPMPLVRFSGDGTEYADEDGVFDLSDGSEWTADLRGDYLSVRNQGGDEASLDVFDSAPLWTDTDADQAEIDTYIFAHQVREWGNQFGPEVEMVTDGQSAFVNEDSACNAYWDGDLHFYQAGSKGGWGCNNTGRIGDVVYHEWGHGFHYWSLEAGDFDSSISEGIGDTVAFLQTLDPDIAPYFYTNGGAIREVSTDLVYPDDWDDYDPHVNGLMFGGAVWDLYLLLSDTYGEAVGDKGTAWEVTSQLVADGIKAGPTIPDAYEEFAIADDDDGDLSNGTPHYCELVEAFGNHGIGPGGESGMTITHSAVGNQPANAAVPVSLDLWTCRALDAEADAEVVFSTDGGVTWDSAPLTAAGDTYSGEIPAQAGGTVVWYYLDVTLPDGSEGTAPSGGVIAPYSFYVGDLEEVYCEDFSGSDGGYTHELLGGNDQEGADDWIFGQPGGYASDPDDAYTGRSVWGNDLGGGNYNGEYQSDIVNRLTSTPITVGSTGPVVVQFRRWLNVEDGFYDHASVYVNEEQAWTNYATDRNDGSAHTQDEEWMLHTLLVTPDADPFTIGWEIDSDGGLTMGGWNIDDVCVYRPMDAVDLTIDDFAASDDLSERVELVWTQPSDDAASEAVVVRRDDRYPENKEDGTVVWSGAATPGAVMTASDPSAGGYYAVFAGGDEGWLTGAVEGANADIGAAVDADGDGLYDGGPAGGDEPIHLQGDCGCASPGGPAGALAAAAGLVAVLRRRR